MVQADAPWKITPSLYFSDGEYLLGNKGMLAWSKVLLPLKAPSSQDTRNRNFNYQHARRPVPAERCIGVIKGRFGRLRDMRIPVATDQDFANASEWVAACTILHNICVCLNDVAPVSAPVSPSAQSQLPLAPAAHLARQRVPRRVLRFLRAKGLYHY